jgi:hypothetical protein
VSLTIASAAGWSAGAPIARCMHLARSATYRFLLAWTCFDGFTAMGGLLPRAEAVAQTLLGSGSCHELTRTGADRAPDSGSRTAPVPSTGGWPCYATMGRVSRPPSVLQQLPGRCRRLPGVRELRGLSSLSGKPICLCDALSHNQKRPAMGQASDLIETGRMPSVVIEVRRSYTAAEEWAIIEAVHEALRTAFRIPPQDRHIRLVVHEPHRFACPPGKPQPGRCT